MHIEHIAMYVNDLDKTKDFFVKYFGAGANEGSGSRVRIKLHGERAIFHRPHPEKTTDKGAVKAVRQFLTNVGVSL